MQGQTVHMDRLIAFLTEYNEFINQLHDRSTPIDDIYLTMCTKGVKYTINVHGGWHENKY